VHRTARKRLGNRVVGEIELTGDALDLAGDGLTMIAYSAEPGSQAEDQLKLLASGTKRPGESRTACGWPPWAGEGDRRYCPHIRHRGLEDSWL
jgi:hypothetical protein